MSKFVTILALIALMAMPVMAETVWDDELSTGRDGTSSIKAGNSPDASGKTAVDNWNTVFGDPQSFAGVYDFGSGWIKTSGSGEPGIINIECDIEMYVNQTLDAGDVYFHLGNLSTATPDDKTAHVFGSFQSNNGQYVGLVFPNDCADNLVSTVANQGIIPGGMKGTFDSRVGADRQSISTKSFPLTITMYTYNDPSHTTYRGPDSFGPGSDNTVNNALWWKVADGATGTWNYVWKVVINPAIDQADGDYGLDPIVACSPAL